MHSCRFLPSHVSSRAQQAIIFSPISSTECRKKSSFNNSTCNAPASLLAFPCYISLDAMLSGCFSLLPLFSSRVYKYKCCCCCCSAVSSVMSSQKECMDEFRGNRAMRKKLGPLVLLVLRSCRKGRDQGDGLLDGSRPLQYMFDVCCI